MKCETADAAFDRAVDSVAVIIKTNRPTMRRILRNAPLALRLHASCDPSTTPAFPLSLGRVG